MWDTFVPERSVKFGDQRFWVLFGIVGMLYTINTIRDARKGPEDPDLPAGAARRLPDGRLVRNNNIIIGFRPWLSFGLRLCGSPVLV